MTDLLKIYTEAKRRVTYEYNLTSDEPWPQKVNNGAILGMKAGLEAVADRVRSECDAEIERIREEKGEVLLLLERVTTGHFGGQPGYINSLALSTAEDFLARHKPSIAQGFEGIHSDIAEIVERAQ